MQADNENRSVNGVRNTLAVSFELPYQKKSSMSRDTLPKFYADFKIAVA
jgi:hypothetical protein